MTTLMMCFWSYIGIGLIWAAYLYYKYRNDEEWKISGVDAFLIYGLFVITWPAEVFYSVGAVLFNKAKKRT